MSLSESPTTGLTVPVPPSNSSLREERYLAIALLLAAVPLVTTGLWWFWTWAGGFDATWPELMEPWRSEPLRSSAYLLMIICGAYLIRCIRRRMSGTLPAPWSEQLRLALATGGLLAVLLGYDFFMRIGYDVSYTWARWLHTSLVAPAVISVVLSIYHLLSPPPAAPIAGNLPRA